MKVLKQDIQTKLLATKKIILDAANLDKEQQIVLCTKFVQNLILELKTRRDEAVRDVIELLYNKGLSDSIKK